MKPSYQSSKLYQADLYDQIKNEGNHIVCLGQDQTKTFTLLAAIRNHAHQLHPKYGSSITVIIEPDREHADDRQRMINDHTELQVINLFGDRLTDDIPSNAQVLIMSMRHVFQKPLARKLVNLVILDFAHLLLLQDVRLVQDVVKRFEGIRLLAFMCSLIHNSHELTPLSTIQLINQLETIFTAKCETSSDLRSLSRQSPVTNMEVIQFDSTELIICDWFLLADSMLKQFCDLLLDTNLDDNEPLIKPDSDLTHTVTKAPTLVMKKQLVLVRSCLSDIIYAMHCLGFWCAKKTIQLYLTEFSRLLQNEPPIGDLLAAASTVLNCFYGRLEDLASRYQLKSKDDIVLYGTSRQLKSVLDYIKEFKSVASLPICIIHVRRRVIAKVMALWLDKVSRIYEEYSFIKPNYIVGSTRKHRNRMAVDNFDLHHETSVRDFRFGNCNTLVTSAASERCTDVPRCNLVVSFDIPARFSDFVQAKGNCRYDYSKYVIMLNSSIEINAYERLLNYINMERLLNNVNKKVYLETEEALLMEELETTYEPYPSKNSKNPATIWRSVAIINKYCTKLPSDSFTKLSPEWSTKDVSSDNGKEFYCEVRLPINSPVRQTVVGPRAPTKNIAMRLAAFTACKVLHQSGELDDNMMPITKESMKSLNPLGGTRDLPPRSRKGTSKGQSIGSTKHRQYYEKRVAEVFSGPLVAEGIPCYLYKFKMVLTCPIPDEQNRRGRRIVDPSETNRNYAIVCTKKLPKICSFPVFTRSGEVLVSVELIGDNFTLTTSQVEDLRIFHEFTFSKVLRLEKYPTVYDPDNSLFTVLLTPVIDKAEGGTNIDWNFVNKIAQNRDTESRIPDENERRAFKFNHDDYVDAVVIPWYRLTDRQQFAYYVAEICTDLTPKSPFPDEDSGFETFVAYYQSKYDIKIYNTSQPVLDVDHTSARLNLLTPRYVNRKGRTLPSSTAKTRRESRESLVQKQLLIPELCSIHPFPASFWRKAVCLPCIFYRLNSLFLAEELRRKVAQETRVGFVEPPEDFNWPPLDFGWSLKDVINGQFAEEEFTEKPKARPKVAKKIEKLVEKHKVSKIMPMEATTTDSSDFVIDYFDPSKYDIPDIALDEPPKDWMNIKLISSSNAAGSDGQTGWDQPLEQHDLLLEHTNEVTWSDCEMEFDGEITESVPQVRCGSPSAFEIGFKSLLDHDDNQTKGIRSAPTNDCNSSKTVKFDEISESSFEGSKQQEKTKEVESEYSWSISDDENLETGNSDDDVRCYGEWKDSKAKNKPLLRELFLPNSKPFRGTTATDIESLYAVMMNYYDRTLNKDDLACDIIKSLDVKNVSQEDEQKLITILNSVFEQKINVDKSAFGDTLTAWYGRSRQLSLRVENTLINDPDMFKDSGIELVTVDDSFNDYNLEIQPSFGELLPNRDVNCDWPSEEWKNIKFDPTRKEIHSNGPGPSVILQALTMSNASDGINLERLETVGDSFLKYSITAYLYCMYPTMHEGKLSYLRSTEISNANLYQLGRSKNLGELMSATKFEPNDNWRAPGYSVAAGVPGGDDENNKKREIDKALAEVPYDLLLQHSIPDKSIADCVEALIGAYLTASGSRAALLFMQWLGLRVVPPSFDLEQDLNQAGDENQIWRWLETPPSPLICIPPSYDERLVNGDVSRSDDQLREQALSELDRHYYANNLDKFEKDTGYIFKDKAYLVQAFTHNSFYENHVTDCHQRLEFLGDALLDYLITRYLFEDPRCHSPGTLTDLRSALVNNTFFASLAVKYKFHKYLKYISDELFHVIDGFVKKFRFDSKDTITKGYTLLISEGESEYAEDIEVPKALGDVFESVAGAIYLDSGMSLDQVWQVYFKMMKPEIEYFSSNVPKSPIRELLESMPQNVRFSPSELAPDRKHRVIAEVFGLGRFTGVGRNKHSAKSTAAKRALRKLLAVRKQTENCPNETTKFENETKEEEEEEEEEDK